MSVCTQQYLHIDASRINDVFEKGTWRHFKSLMAERRHAVFVGAGGNRTHTAHPKGAGYARLAQLGYGDLDNKLGYLFEKFLEKTLDDCHANLKAIKTAIVYFNLASAVATHAIRDCACFPPGSQRYRRLWNPCSGAVLLSG